MWIVVNAVAPRAPAGPSPSFDPSLPVLQQPAAQQGTTLPLPERSCSCHVFEPLL
jgi:hypothetical protein